MPLSLFTPQPEHTPLHRSKAAEGPGTTLIMAASLALLAGAFAMIGVVLALLGVPLNVAMLPSVLLLAPAVMLFAGDLIKNRRRT